MDDDGQLNAFFKGRGIARTTMSRTDLAALVLVLVFGAFANAAGMVAPVLEWQDQLSSLLRQRSLYQSMRNSARRSLRQLRRMAPRVAEIDREDAEKVLTLEDDVLERLRSVTGDCRRS